MIPVLHGYLDYIDTHPEEFCKEHRLLPKWLRPILDTSVIDEEAIATALRFCDEYVPFERMAWEDFQTAVMVGVLDEYGDPVFNEFFDYMGRGAGKNGYISTVILLLLSNVNGIRNYDVHLVANSEENAKTSFEEVSSWILDNKKLKQAFEVGKQRITFKRTNSTLKFMTANPKTKYGGRPGAVIFDEVLMYENYDQIKVHRGGLGKIEQSRTFYLTTDGHLREGVLDDLKERARKVLRGELPHNGFFPLMFRLDDKKEAEKERCWVKANPRIPFSRTLAKELRKAYADALENDSLMEEFLTTRMNVPHLSVYKSVASEEEIYATNQPIPDLTGAACIGAIDFTYLRDFCAVGLLFHVGRKVYVLHHTFIHEKSLENTKYAEVVELAINRGIAEVVRNVPIIPASVVVEWFLRMATKYQIQTIVADRARVAALQDAFLEYGIEIEQVPNGFYTHSKLHPQITQLFAENRLVYGDDPLMRWYTFNTMVVTDAKGNKSYQKIDPIKRKTDGFSMLIHGMSRMDLIQEVPSFDLGVI